MNAIETEASILIKMNEDRSLNSQPTPAVWSSNHAGIACSPAKFARRATRKFAPLLLAALSLVVHQAAAEIPRSHEGHPDLSGIWQTLGNVDSGLEAHAVRRD